MNDGNNIYKIGHYLEIVLMSKRITIVLDDNLLMKLRRKQAQLIKESTKSVSFSRVLNETLRKCIK